MGAEQGAGGARRSDGAAGPLRGRLTAAAGGKAGRRAMALAARHPRLWRFVRGGMRRRFDRAAERWSGISGRIDSPHFAPVRGGLAQLPSGFAPADLADLGAGTGLLALGLAERFPGARVRGFDLSPGMIAAARRHLETEPWAAALQPRVRFDVADSSCLPVGAGAFDLVFLSNTPVFFAEVARVLRPGGLVVVSFSHGPRTPLYLPVDELRAGLSREGLTVLGRGEAGTGEWLLARR